MTNKDRLKALLGFQLANDNTIDAEFIDVGMDAQGTYVPGNRATIIKAAIRICYLLLTTPNQTNNEGITLTYDRDAVLNRIAQLGAEIDDKEVKRPRITSVKPW